MVFYEIAGSKTRNIYQSKDCISLRGNNGLTLNYIYDDDKDLHVVEIEQYYTQLEVRTDFQSKAKALDFMFTFKHILPKLKHYLEDIVTAKGSLHLNLSTDFNNYTQSYSEELTNRYEKQDSAITQRIKERMQETLGNTSLIVPDYSQVELRLFAFLN